MPCFGLLFILLRALLGTEARCGVCLCFECLTSCHESSSTAGEADPWAAWGSWAAQAAHCPDSGRLGVAHVSCILMLGIDSGVEGPAGLREGLLQFCLGLPGTSLRGGKASASGLACAASADPICSCARDRLLAAPDVVAEANPSVSPPSSAALLTNFPAWPSWLLLPLWLAGGSAALFVTADAAGTALLQSGSARSCSALMSCMTQVHHCQAQMSPACKHSLCSCICLIPLLPKLRNLEDEAVGLGSVQRVYKHLV